ncbi:MAG: DUF3795 domain-containing protein [Euryarchaeota archaeon]|nr:DUF3795 domain-containing protein [Euryarchaeota archaeon]
MTLEYEIGACGLACYACLAMESGVCPGCERSQPLLVELAGFECPIYECTRRLGVANCLRCNIRSCDLRRGLSKGYCPAYTCIVVADVCV